MNKKILVVICLIICIILSLHAVVAVSDVNDTEEIVSVGTNVTSVSASGTEDLLGNDNEESFTDLNKVISEGGTSITLDKNYTYSSSDSSLVNGITISRSVTIDGQGKVIIDANNQARIFNIASGSTVKLTGITFVNAYNAGNGSAINSNGVVNLIDCTFTNNVAGGHGGAVYMESTSGCTIDGCTFESNTAGSNGGAVDWSAGSSNGKVTNSVFNDNTAKRSGGAIHWSGHYGIIDNCNFTNNKATGEVTTTIGGFDGSGDGGAVIWVGSHGLVSNSRFINNTAIHSSTYDHSGRGGAIFVHGNDTESCTNTTVDSCVFINNTAGDNGGAVDWYEGSRDGALTNSVFTNNTAKRSAGAVHWSGYYGVIDNCNFTGNKATGEVSSTISGFNGSGDGGAVIWVGSHGLVNNSRFINNTAISASNLDYTGRGGALFIHNNDKEDCINTTVANSVFIGNIAGDNGGAIDWYAGSQDGKLLNSVFINNTAKRSAGAVHWSGHYGIIDYCNFTGNKATGEVVSEIGGFKSAGDGGAIIWVGGHGLVNNSRFEDNVATYNNAYEYSGRGGAIFIHGNDTEACTNTTVDNSVFIGNIAGDNGGAVDWYAGSTYGKLLNSVFTDNLANRSAGAVHWSGHYGIIDNCNFTHNTAAAKFSSTIGGFEGSGDGGAIIWVGSHGLVNNSRFINNTAVYNSTHTYSGRGGAIFLHGNSTENATNTTVDGCTFIDNVAGCNGGAIDWYFGAHDGNVLNSVFERNIAKRSGGLYIGMEIQVKLNILTSQPTKR